MDLIFLKWKIISSLYIFTDEIIIDEFLKVQCILLGTIAEISNVRKIWQ